MMILPVSKTLMWSKVLKMKSVSISLMCFASSVISANWTALYCSSGFPNSAVVSHFFLSSSLLSRSAFHERMKASIKITSSMCLLVQPCTPLTLARSFSSPYYFTFRYFFFVSIPIVSTIFWLLCIFRYGPCPAKTGYTRYLPLPA